MTQENLLFLNQYFPPDPAPTGILLKEIADNLSAEGYQCSFICAPQEYRAQNKTRRRLVRELSALWSILVAGLRAPKPKWVIVGSSPPCLAVVGAIMARFHGAKSIHWAMDLYPELALELGELRPGLFFGLIRRAMRWAYGQYSVVVALDQDMGGKFEAYGVSPRLIRPWLPALQCTSRSPDGYEAPPLWIYSGNLGRAHEWETLLQAQVLLEKQGSPVRLVFQGGGASWAPAQARALELGLRQCEWRPYVEEDQLRATLSQARAIVVTQKRETQGLLWPSKLALAMDLPRPILWVGPKGAISDLLSQSQSAGVFEPGDADGIAKWLLALEPQRTEKVCDAATHRQQALAEWKRLLECADMSAL